MISLKQIQKWLVTSALVATLVFSFGCASHPNDEQIRQMEETRSAALSAEQRLEELTKQRQQLEGELSQKQQEAQNCEDEKAEVQKRLENWGSN
ncbi:MAG: hypothetical protein D6748_02620 [Calditrichaeota bacterium]|nr:MAG: hypothetical protein D6748_02620 [Calditrichota bacterium]